MEDENVPAAAGKPFDSPEFLADIHPWLLSLDADMFREAAQQNQLLRTFDSVADLEDTLQREGRKAHNKKLIQIISANELHGYQRLCHVVAEMGYHTRVHQMLNQLPEKDRPCLDLPSAVDMATTSVRRRARTGVDGGNGDSDGRAVSQRPDENASHGEEEGHGAEERNETAAEHEASSSAAPEAVPAQKPKPFLAMVAGLSLLIIAVISVYYVCSVDYGFSPSVDRAEHLLKIRYGKANEIYSPMFEATTANTVDNIYINLVMLPKRNLSEEFKNEFKSSSDDMWRTEHAFTRAGQRMQSVHLESLLDRTHHGPSSHRTGQTLGTIVMASAGCGKSFVFTRVAPIKWAAGELWPNKKLLVARELRFPDVHKATSLSKLLGLDGIGIEDSNALQEICDHVSEHPESLVLILDGLDEVNLKDMSSFVYDVLFGKELQGIHLIVTSRPCADIFQLSVLPHFHQHIELLGFNQDDVERYISSALSPEKAETLIAEVNRSAYLSGMMATPFMAQEVCVQYHFGLDAPQCMADMFEQMIVQIINRKYGRKYKQWNEVPVEAQLLVMEMGQFAFNMLAEKQMIFNDVDLQKHSLSEHAFKLGLLVTSEESLSRKIFRQHRFSHLTTQEYLAAIYLARHPTHNVMNSPSIIRLVEILGAETAHLRTFWTMLCAQLNTAQAECLVNSLLTRQKVEEQDEEGILHHFYRYTSHVHIEDLAQPPNISAYFERSHDKRRYLQSLAFHSFAELAMQRKMVNSPLSSIRALLRSEQKVSIDSTDHPAEIRSIDIVLRHHPQDVQRVDIKFWSMYDNGRVPSSLANCSGIRVLEFSIPPNSHGDVATFTSAVQHSAKNLLQLTVRSTFVWLSNLTEGTTPMSSSLIAALSTCHQLRVLELTSGILTTSNAGALASALSNLTTLQQIKLRGSVDLSSDDVAAITRALHRSSNLSTVDFIYCGLTASVLPAITTALQHWKRLKTLRLSHNDFSGTDALVASQFFSALSKLTDLRRIELSYCSLPESSGSALATELSNISTLYDIALSQNYNLGDEVVIDILHALRQCKDMSDVDLTNCGLTAASLPAITAALHSWPNLYTLQLTFNNFRDVTDDQANSFIAAAKAHGKLSGNPFYDSLMDSTQNRAFLALKSAMLN
ncbi:uncharacterized protein LOC135819755 isoform X2 [Sycon ciliatum]|uniref:uncharacterized protein LOC135819755 isoform X2 n=1 Tax=Sycon ciliatum TaxID=27933 RepID=UPI0031F610BF